ncbi:MAG: hypothetical protein LBK68_02740 [Candidatus Margulisbacteria bacterium]|jgi:hypothetical protein|nr:hypothetical protein [Candidatus Margulisiibacteriota bacterium]
MANNYTDKFEGTPYFIKKGEQLSAAGMTAALNTKEKVTNKTDTIDSSNSSSTAQYPSVKAVSDSLNVKDNGALHKAGAETITGIKTFGTTDAAAEPLLGMAKTADAADNGTKFATEAQVYAVNSVKQDKLSDAQLALLNSLSTLSFFPRGTILTFSAAAWDAKDSAFKAVWKICNGQNGTPNLIDKFLRGGDYGNDRETGGTNTAQVPYHNHGFTGTNQTGYLPVDFTANKGIHPYYSRYPDGVFSVSSTKPDNETVIAGAGWVAGRAGYHFSMTPTGNIGYTGSNADNRPEFYTVIYIIKIS